MPPKCLAAFSEQENIREKLGVNNQKHLFKLNSNFIQNFDLYKNKNLNFFLIKFCSLIAFIFVLAQICAPQISAVGFQKSSRYLFFCFVKARHKNVPWTAKIHLRTEGFLSSPGTKVGGRDKECWLVAGGREGGRGAGSTDRPRGLLDRSCKKGSFRRPSRSFSNTREFSWRVTVRVATNV